MTSTQSWILEMFIKVVLFIYKNKCQETSTRLRTPSASVTMIVTILFINNGEDSKQWDNFHSRFWRYVSTASDRWWDRLFWANQTHQLFTLAYLKKAHAFVPLWQNPDRANFHFLTFSLAERVCTPNPQIRTSESGIILRTKTNNSWQVMSVGQVLKVVLLCRKKAITPAILGQEQIKINRRGSGRIGSDQLIFCCLQIGGPNFSLHRLCDLLSLSS